MNKIIKYKYPIIAFIFELALIVLISKHLFGWEYLVACLCILASSISHYYNGMQQGIQIMKDYNKRMWDNK